jgi:hypothetical protein
MGLAMARSHAWSISSTLQFMPAAQISGIPNTRQIMIHLGGGVEFGRIGRSHHPRFDSRLEAQCMENRRVGRGGYENRHAIRRGEQLRISARPHANGVVQT